MAKKTKEKNKMICDDKELWFKATSLYLDEWKHRDGVYYKFATTFYFCAVVVSLFPYVKFVEGSISIKNGYFAASGMVIAFLTSVTIFLMALRNGNVYNRYNDLLGAINENFEHEKSKIPVKIAQVIPWIIFVAIVVMNIILLRSNHA